MPAYFAMGYFSWAIASILVGKRDDSILVSELWLLPILSSFFMVMWDICIAPTSGFWVWHNGGVRFGAPFVNFLGWHLGVFTFYFVFALYLHSIRKGDNINHSLVLMNLFTMIFISFLGVVPSDQDDANCSYE